MTDSCLTHYECTKTGEQYNGSGLHGLSKSGAPLFARYDLEQAARRLSKEKLKARRRDMWRYHELLPIQDITSVHSLGEGWTPLYRLSELERESGISGLFVKDEGRNPTGSFKVRGLSASVHAAGERGARNFAMPSAGNAAGALAAYTAVNGFEAHVFMPNDTPLAFRVECEAFGASVTYIDGLISECGQRVAELKDNKGWYDVSTLKEPFRIEGKKTMGFELAEQFNWQLPDVIIYPTGGGTGLIGMWKAFQELEAIGWIGEKRPRMVSVQSEGCAPIVKAFELGMDHAEPWKGARTLASGLRVPGTVGDFLILQALYESNGKAVAVSDEELIDASYQLARHTGMLPAPEGGATLAALLRLKEEGWIGQDDQVLLFNTGSGYKYLEALNSRQLAESSPQK